MSIVLLSMLAARAEDSAFAGAATPAGVEEPETHLTGELGGAFSTGNAYYYTVNGLVAASHQVKKDKISFAGGVNIGGARAGIDADADGVFERVEDDYSENVRKVYGDLRYDRFLTDKDSIYALAGALHDPFAGYDVRAHEQLGYSRLLVKNEDTEVKSEIGGDVAQEDYVDGVDPAYMTIVAARVLLGVTHAFNEEVSFSETVEVYENLIDFEDLRVLNTAALTASLSGKLSLKISHSLAFDNVPVESFAPLDQTSMVTLVLSIL
jgi:putative salt-induced outer membrane protein